ncbi:MAG TPA: neutral zinc metallopeptidase [Bryobacteraceae bacterium]|nr:neutral zinc metallopeptidase [Bryobacteraceae bacterium]
MRWTPGGMSGDIEDRRGMPGLRPGHIGIGGLLLLLLLSLVFKRDFVSMFTGGAPVAPSAAPSPVETPAEANLVQFVSFVLDDAQQTWDKLLPEQAGVPYRHAKLVLFRDLAESACGVAQSSTGPFYCPADEKVYIDLGFYDELRDRFGAPGEFAQAYVLSHEIGHHVQNILGIAGKVQRFQRQNPDQANPLSVQLELQADCLAGVWAHSTKQRNLIDKADIQAGIQAAGAVGDDRLQKMAQGRVSPESFTHGSSSQRVAWFERGIESGQISDCNTFQER